MNPSISPMGNGCKLCAGCTGCMFCGPYRGNKEVT